MTGPVSALLLAGVALGATAPDGGMVLVPAGEFVMGSPDGGWDEAPPRRLQVRAFLIDRTPVTNAQFARWVRDANAGDRIEGGWWRYSAEGCRDLLAGDRAADSPRHRAVTAALAAMAGGGSGDALIKAQADLPVRGVTWRDAAAFAAARGCRLATEAEWEKAARGSDGRIFPWGNDWQVGRCRAGPGAQSGPVTVGSFPAGASPYGCLDMAGNVWEWVADWYGEREYVRAGEAPDPTGPPGLPDGRLPAPDPALNLLRDPRQGRETDTRKVIRGGGYASRVPFDVRTTRRLAMNPGADDPDLGFRCARSVP